MMMNEVKREKVSFISAFNNNPKAAANHNLSRGVMFVPLPLLPGHFLLASAVIINIVIINNKSGIV